ncbi:MAG: glycosyltransferase family 4 protein [Desulfobulbaceae bacterium]|nr:glycosyltransferase family 4 protein [Desulfobulbaceae bacterium]
MRASDVSAHTKPKILVLASTFPRWSDDKEPPFVFELCRRLCKEFDVTVLAPHAADCKTREVMDGILVYRFRYCCINWQTLAYKGGILENLKRNPIKFFLVPFFLFFQFLFLVQLLKKENFNLIHAHWIIPQGLIAVLAKSLLRLKIPLLCTSHGGDLYALKGKILGNIKSFVIKQSEKLTVVSNAMKESALLYYKKADIQIIPMGVDLSNQFIPGSVPKKENSLLYVGRLVEKKGIRYLIESLSEVVTKHPGVQLQIAGSGPNEDKLVALVHHLNLSPHVTFLGPIHNNKLPALYQKSQIVVFPSIVARDGDREGFGLVLVEALGCECAVIATDLAAMEDIVENDKTGCIVRQKNSKDLTQKINYLLSHPEICTALGKAGRKYVQAKYDWEIIASRYASLMKEMFI